MNKLRFWRLERGLSQIELAEVSGIPRHEIQLTEQEKRVPSPEQIEALAIVLGVSKKQLLGAREDVRRLGADIGKRRRGKQ